MENHTLFIFFVIFIAFIFEFINGFHDAANAIATIVTTKVLTPKQAVLWAAFFNFIAFLIFNLMVAKTIGHGLIDTHLVDPLFILIALAGAIFWNLVTWYFGMPSSSSHALIGGLAGAAIAKGGFAALKLSGFYKVLLGILFSPILGLGIGLFFTYLFNFLIQGKKQAAFQKIFRILQLASSALLSVTHGGNDAQKTMGIIALLLFSLKWTPEFSIPFWVVISCQTVMSLGTLAGGFRIVRTMGTEITKLNPLKGCAAETGAAITIFAATELGIPVSTTHTVTGAITGSGLISGIKEAHWVTLRKIGLIWLTTIPGTAVVSMFLMWCCV